MSNLEKLFSLKGKKAFITGGAQGIGRALALGLAGAGADVAIVDLNPDKGEQTVGEVKALGVNSFFIKADVTNPADVANMKKAIMEKFGRLDIAINNAGIAVHAPAEEMSFAEWQKVIGVNLNGVFLCAQAAAQIMIPQKSGSIINTASMSATIVNIPQPQCSYNASKAGVVHLTKSLAVEWARHNIRVNCFSPGYIKTELTGTMRQDWRDSWMGQSVMKRMGVPEDLVAAVILMASDSSTFMTGADVIIDGAFTCV